jgi:type IX secretion system substrate protein
MKKCYTLLIILVYSQISKAQIYYPMLDSSVNTWYYTFNILPVSPPGIPPAGVPCNYGNSNFFGSSVKYYTQGDSVINSLSYQKLMFDNYLSTAGCTYGYLREDTSSRKIYFMDNVFSPEILLYDFSMQPGDSISLNFVFPGYWQNGVYTLDSIVVKQFAAGSRNVFYLDCHSCSFSMPMVWIESIGNQGDLIYSHSINSQSWGWFSFCSSPLPTQFPYDFIEILTCFEHVPKVYLDSCCLQQALTNSCLQFADSCNYWNICGSVDEHDFISSFDISPNPASEEITVSIQSSKTSYADFILTDMTGKELVILSKHKIIPGKQEFNLTLPRLSKGIYLVECHEKKGSVYRKLVITGN